MRWTLDDLDFPVLVLRDPAEPAELTGLGGSGSAGPETVAIGYGRTGTGSPALRLETMVRRGHRLSAQGHPTWTDTELPQLAADAVRPLLLADLSARVTPHQPATGHLVEQVEARVRALADAVPGPPWDVVAADVDGTPFALWIARLDEGFAAVLDHGPVVLTAFGTTAPPPWQLTVLTPDAARAVLDPNR